METQYNIWNHLTNSPDIEVRKREYELVTSGKLHINSFLLYHDALKLYIGKDRKLLFRLASRTDSIDCSIANRLLAIYCVAFKDVVYSGQHQRELREFCDYLMYLDDVPSIVFTMTNIDTFIHVQKYICSLYTLGYLSIVRLREICTMMHGVLKQDVYITSAAKRLYSVLVEFEEKRGGDIRPVVEAVSMIYGGKVLNYALQFGTKERNDILIEMIKAQDVSLYEGISDRDIEQMVMNLDNNVEERIVMLSELLSHIGVSRDRLLSVIQEHIDRITPHGPTLFSTAKEVLTRENV